MYLSMKVVLEVDTPITCKIVEILKYCEYDLIGRVSHINSVEADNQGNYIISGYHVCTIYKINGTDGSVIWRLGGDKSNFKMLDGYNLRYVHHVRIQDLASISLSADLRSKVSKETHLALSIFDNAFDTAGPTTAHSSSAIVVLLDHTAMTAEVVERYIQPHDKYAAMFGSVQFLENGDRFIGWGSTREISQHNQDGEIVYQAAVGDERSAIGSLRAFKGVWSATPLTDPDLYVYSWTCDWNTTMYASWNGATAVESWTFSGGSSASGPWKEIAVAAKHGFETQIQASFFVKHAFVEAVGADGQVLGISKVVRSQVPRAIFSRGCNELCCPQTLVWHDNADACEDREPGIFPSENGQIVLNRDSGL